MYFFTHIKKLLRFLRRLFLRIKAYCQRRLSTSNFYEIYLNYCQSNVSRSHFLSIQKHLAIFWKTVGHRSDLLEISATDIENFKSQFLKGTSSKTVNKVLKYVKAMFSRAIDWGYLTNNPAKAVKIIKVPKSDLAYCLTLKEIKGLLQKCPSWFHPVIYTFLATGMRRGELIHLRWCDIDMNKRLIHIRNQEAFHTKNYLPRTVGMKRTLYEILHNIQSNGNGKHQKSGSESDGEYVFLSAEGIRYSGSVIQKIWMKVRRELGINYRLHDFRHTFCSFLILRGVDLKTVQVLMGHSDPRTTMKIYAHVHTAHLQHAVEKLPY